MKGRDNQFSGDNVFTDGTDILPQRNGIVDTDFVVTFNDHIFNHYHGIVGIGDHIAGIYKIKIGSFYQRPGMTFIHTDHSHRFDTDPIHS
jgi:hypothetical protein